jgi:hypothetical protein
MPVRDRLAGRIPPIRTRRVTGNSLGSLRQIVNRSRYRSPWAELAPFEHAPLPVNCCELHCGTRCFRTDGTLEMSRP